ncbi:MAG: aromatic ring-hydroxylating dioxygenase subunit alpha [Pseudomonadota bacterium]
MDQGKSIALLRELKQLKATKRAFLDADVERSPIARYTDPARFQQEQAWIRSRPCALAHSSELSEPGAFLTLEHAGLPLLLTRDRSGQVRAFLNVCRHRGARLVDESSGCKHRFSCPYHAWTYGDDGRLIGVPHEAQGFPNLDRASHGLHALRVSERHGFVWVWDDRGTLSIDDWLKGFGPDLAGFELDASEVKASTERTAAANWKLLVEGGLEAYHFRVAHAQTIGPYFEDNLSSYQTAGLHLRSVLPRTKLDTLNDAAEDGWVLRDAANLLYTFLPFTQLLVQQDHVIWIRFQPLNAAQTQLRLVTLAPRDAGPLAHWAQNHDITLRTLYEDFALGEGVQSNLASGANQALTFGRFEGALGKFNRNVEAELAVMPVVVS